MFKILKKKIFNFFFREKNVTDLRIDQNKVSRQESVSLTIDGKKIKAPNGEMLAATLFINEILNLNYSSKIKEPRGFFCLMGSCQECRIMLNDEIVLACQEVVREGIRIKTGLKK